MEKKKIIAAVSLLVTLVILIVIVLRKQPSQTETSTPNTPRSASSSSSSKTVSFPIYNSENQKYTISKLPSNPDKSLITTPQGNQIEINNPKKIAKEKLDEKDLVLESNGNYDIMYFNYSKGPSFLITLSSPDLESSRTAGESKLIDLLGISKDQACKLNVSLTVPQDVSSPAAGYDYGLSFCPNGKPFPK
ncbi:MAG: hypothetical protein HGB08_04120 [Candidatus Moranbacteria bacterium]|nr:hypothetical protein [Candidatus Moranbacteria bacterium]